MTLFIFKICLLLKYKESLEIHWVFEANYQIIAKWEEITAGQRKLSDISEMVYDNFLKMENQICIPAR